MKRRAATENQSDLFVGDDQSPQDSAWPLIGPAQVSEEVRALAAKLPREIRLGSSSWYFPGWEGIVWDRAADEKTVTREGLAAYTRHPLLRTVGIDRTFYAPISTAEYARYAGQAAAGFRCVVKAPKVITTPEKGQTLAACFAEAGVMGEGKVTSRFLNADYATKALVQPATAGLADKLGVLLFQFSPLARAFTSQPVEFAEALGRFLGALPKLPNDAVYAVELRNSELLSDAYAHVLHQTGARHCIGVHPRTPDVALQAQLVQASSKGPLVVRWNLNPRTGRDYESARDLYRPFNRLVDEDQATRQAIAKACVENARAGQGVYVVINNKAEGSAPLSAIKLAQEIVALSV